MRAAVESYTSHSQTNMMRDISVIMKEVDTFDEREVISSLTDESYNRRSEILEQLRNSVRIGQSLPFRNSIALFQALSIALADTNWGVRRQCLLLISEYIPLLRVDVDACMGIILPRLISNVGDNKVVIRKDAIQTLHTYMKHTGDMPSLMNRYVQNGLENSDSKVRKESIVSLPMLITSDFVSEDFSDIIVSLCKKLADRNEDESLQNHSRNTLSKLRDLTGDTKFRSYMMKLSPSLRDYSCKLLDFPLELERANNTSNQFYNSTPVQPLLNNVLHFGVVPAAMMEQLSNQENFRSRGQAVEELKMTIERLPSISPLIPHINGFINMLNGLLDDNNFKIITVTLDIMGTLVERVSHEIRPHLKPVIETLTKRMGDNKNVIRQAITKVVVQLMQILGPKLVLLLLNNNLSHRSPRVRTETINCIINALHKFPRDQFDLDSLCTSMAYCLLDPKKSVRHACLECLAVLAQCLGPSKLGPLFYAVENLEHSYGGDAEGVKDAVQARLTRRTLPKINEDGLVEYAIQLPNLNSSRNGALGHQGADIDWIQAGSGGGGSSARSSGMRLEDLESVSRQSSASLDGRRHLSAGKKPKLPWDESQKSPNNSLASPVKSKQSWADEADSVKKPANKFAKQKDDMMLASINMNGSLEQLSNIPNGAPQNDVEMNHNDVSALNKPPFSKSINKSIKNEASNTWSTNKIGRKEGADSSPSVNRSIVGKPVLNPLPVESSTGPLANTWAFDSPKETAQKEPTPSSIPLKASPVQRKNANKKSKVPPISKSESPTTMLDDSTLMVDSNGNELPQLNASLNKIRNSASKKKAEKLFEKLEKRESEAEIVVNSSSSAKSQSSQPLSKPPNPFESKPKLARHNAQSKPKSHTDSSSSTKITSPELRNQDNTKSNKNDYKPKQKESILDKVSPKVPESKQVPSVIGKGYSEDSVETPPKNSLVGIKSREKNRSKLSMGSSLSPLGLASSNSPGMIPIDDDADLVSVIGRGMFEGDTTKPRVDNSISIRSERSNSMSKSLPHGPYQDTEDETDEEVNTLQMSRALRENAAKKKREREEASAAKRRAQQEKEEAQRINEEELRKREQELAAERRRKQQEAAEKRRKELEQRKREQTSEDHNHTQEASLRIAGSSNLKSVPSKFSSSLPQSASSNYPTEEQLQPFSKPDVALREALRLMSNEDWNDKCDGINKIRRLTSFHRDILSSQLHTVSLAMLAEVKNLRTQVARLAIIGLGDLFSSLKRSMDPELEASAKILLHKNGEANDFIRSELDRTLGAMVSETTPQRCLQAIIAGGSLHKNSTVRKVAAQHMACLCEKLGPGRLLSGVKDLTDRALPAIAALSTDASPVTRWYAKKILLMLTPHPDFEQMLTKHISPKDARTVKEVADTLRQKGLGDIPSDSPSAKGARRSGTFNRGSRTNSAESTDSLSNSMRHRSLPPNAAEETAPLLENMSSNDWNTRHQSINELVDFVQAKPRLVSAQSVKIFDRYANLIKDSNSKVALHALQSLEGMLPQIRQEILSSSINLLVQNTSLNLASKNKEIYEKSSSLLDAYINSIDHTALFQPFVQVAKNCTAKTKPDIIDRVAYLTKKVYKIKPKAVILHALPLAWELVRSGMNTSAYGALRAATQDFMKILYDLLGHSLYDHASSAPGSNPQFVERVKEMTS